MFACVGRGKEFYNGVSNVESTAFSELYPGIPLLGFFGDGEIGFDFPHATPPDGSDGPAARRPSMPRLFQSFTSVFVMLSFT